MGSVLDEKTTPSTELPSEQKNAENTSTTIPTEPPPPAKTASSAPLGMKHYPSCQSTFQPPHIANGNAFLGDVFTTTTTTTTGGPDADADADAAPITCGFYRLAPGKPLVYTYTYHEMKIILEGEFFISDETGKKVTARAGDVFYFPKGATITFETHTYGLAFYTGQRKEGAA